MLSDVFLLDKRGFEISNTSPIDDGPTTKGEVAEATLPHCRGTWWSQSMSLDEGILTERPPMLQR